LPELFFLDGVSALDKLFLLVEEYPEVPICVFSSPSETAPSFFPSILDSVYSLKNSFSNFCLKRFSKSALGISLKDKATLPKVFHTFDRSLRQHSLGHNSLEKLS
jgi:hypothetical protein